MKGEMKRQMPKSLQVCRKCLRFRILKSRLADPRRVDPDPTMTKKPGSVFDSDKKNGSVSGPSIKKLDPDSTLTKIPGSGCHPQKNWIRMLEKPDLDSTLEKQPG